MLVFLLACREVEYPSGLEPLEENTAPWPEATPQEPFPEELATTIGNDGDLWWVHARGWIHAPLADTIAALAQPEVVMDRREVDEWTVEQDIDPSVDTSFRLHETVHDVITVEFDIEWRQDLVDGAPDDPEILAARFEKTDGSSVIETLVGSVLLSVEDDETTAFEAIEHLEALQGEAEPARQYLTDLHASVAASAQGEALPTYP